MKIDFLVVGKTAQSGFTEGITEYCNRIKRYIPFDMVVIPELKNTKKSQYRTTKKNEKANWYWNQFRDGDFIVLLDEHGKEFSSMQFAEYIEKKCIRLPDG